MPGALRARQVLAGALAMTLACEPHAAGAAGSSAAAKDAKADQGWVEQRASEAGAWWMLVQTACDADTATKLLDEMNAGMAAIARHELQPLVVERIEDPFLEDNRRLEMERLMQQAVAARRQADEMQQAIAALETRKGGSLPVQAKDWKVARPVKSAADLDAALRDTERALARYCAQGTASARAILFDPGNGLVARLRAEAAR